MPRLSATELGLPETVACPFCDRGETELHSAFGSQLSVATYWCRPCGTAFEWFKGSSASKEAATTLPAPGDGTGTRSLPSRKE